MAAKRQAAATPPNDPPSHEATATIKMGEAGAVDDASADVCAQLRQYQDRTRRAVYAGIMHAMNFEPELGAPLDIRADVAVLQAQIAGLCGLLADVGVDPADILRAQNAQLDALRKDLEAKLSAAFDRPIDLFK